MEEPTDLQGAVGVEHVEADVSPATQHEVALVAELRAALELEPEAEGEALTEEGAEMRSDKKLLRFLRGYGADVAAAADAYRAMLVFRAANGVDAMRAHLLREGLPWPYTLSKFAPLVALIGAGLMHPAGRDRRASPTTTVVLEHYKLARICAAGLGNLLLESNMYVDQYRDLLLHAETVATHGARLTGGLVAFHDVICVDNIGVAPFDLAGLRLVKAVSENSKHYPETVGRITSCGNSWLALTAWKVIKRFVPAHTTRKIAVLGVHYAPTLLEVVPPTALSRRMGGLHRSANPALDAAFAAGQPSRQAAAEVQGAAAAAGQDRSMPGVGQGLGVDGTGWCRSTVCIPARGSYTFVVPLRELLSVATASPSGGGGAVDAETARASADGTVLVQWEAQLKAHDVVFSVRCRGAADGAQEGTREPGAGVEELRTAAPLLASTGAERGEARLALGGSVGAEDARMLEMRWDNGSSFMRTKTVFFSAYVVVDEDDE